MTIRVAVSGQNAVRRYYAFVLLRNSAFFGAVLIPFYTDWAHISLTQVQLLQSWFMLWIFVLEVPTGAIADLFGRKLSLVLSGLVVTVAALVYGSVPSFEAFLLGEFLFGVAMALASGADSALLYDLLKEAGREQDSKAVFGKAHAVAMLGIALSAPLGSLIAVNFGLNYPMLLSSVPFLLSAAIALSIREPATRSERSERRSYLEIARSGIVFFATHNALRRMALDGVLVGAAAYFVIWLYQPLLRSIGFPILYFGLVASFLTLTEMVVAGNFVRLEKWAGSGKRYLSLTALGTGLTFALAALFPNWVTALLFILVAGGFGLTRLELLSAYMNRHIPSDQRATVLSSFSMFRRLVLMIANPVVGFLADNSLPVALLGVGMLPLLVFLFSPMRQEMLES